MHTYTIEEQECVILVRTKQHTTADSGNKMFDMASCTEQRAAASRYIVPVPKRPALWGFERRLTLSFTQAHSEKTFTPPAIKASDQADPQFVAEDRFGRPAGTIEPRKQAAWLLGERGKFHGPPETRPPIHQLHGDPVAGLVADGYQPAGAVLINTTYSAIVILRHNCHIVVFRACRVCRQIDVFLNDAKSSTAQHFDLRRWQITHIGCAQITHIQCFLAGLQCLFSKRGGLDHRRHRCLEEPNNPHGHHHPHGCALDAMIPVHIYPVSIWRAKACCPSPCL